MEGYLTIIVPCYNAEKYIERCTSSLEGINEDEVAIIFVNDGSVDSSKAMIEQWIKKHPNASLINRENGGYSSAINMGLDHCQSEYVMFVGIDDELISSGINKICKELRRNHPDILAFTTTKKFDDTEDQNKEEVDPVTYYENPGVFNMDIYDLFSRLGNDIRILFTRDTSRCFKMSVIDKLRYFGRTGVSADGCFSSLIACRSRSFELINENCYLWHVHRDSVSSKRKTIDKIIEEADVWSAYYSEIKKNVENKKIPSPIISQVYVYKRLIDQLHEMNQHELAYRHEEDIKDFLRWIKDSKYLSTKSRIMVRFPSMYNLYYRYKSKKKLGK